MPSAVKFCPGCNNLVLTEQWSAHVTAHAPPSTRATTIGRAVGSVVMWIFLAGCLAAFVAVVIRLIRWSVA